MDLLKKEDLGILLEAQNEGCASIYLTTHRKAAETRQNSTRFKNLLREAEKEYISAYPGKRNAQQFFAPAYRLLEDSLFWLHQGDGLAVFITKDNFFVYRLPIELQELVLVSERFHVKPLLPLLTGDHNFYLLALSQNSLRLFHCTRYNARELDSEKLPRSLRDALKFDLPESQLQFYTGTQPQPGGRRPALFFGHGAGSGDNKNEILRYFQQVDAGMHELLREEKAPLILAGVEYLFSIYARANTYPHLLDEGVPGNPDERSQEALHRHALEIIQPHFEKERKKAADKILDFAGTGLASGDIGSVVPAAFNGRIDTLFVPKGIEAWGTFDPADQSVSLGENRNAGDEDLLDFSALKTLAKGGTVYVVDPGEIPGRTLLAALFRY